MDNQPPAVGQKATLFVVAIIVLCALTIISIVVLQIARPDQDNTAIVTAIIGITAPILIALLGVAVQQVHLAVNSRLTQLIELTAKANLAQGALDERSKNDSVTKLSEPVVAVEHLEKIEINTAATVDALKEKEHVSKLPKGRRGP